MKFLISKLVCLQYAGFRKGLLAAYVIVVVLFVVALVLIVVLAPIEETFNKLKGN